MLKTEKKYYPNGKEFYEFIFENKVIGSATKEHDGWLVWGHRKAVTTELQAAKQMLDKHLSRCRVELNKWDKVRMKLFTR